MAYRRYRQVTGDRPLFEIASDVFSKLSQRLALLEPRRSHRLDIAWRPMQVRRPCTTCGAQA